MTFPPVTISHRRKWNTTYIRISVHKNGVVVVTRPWYVSKRKAIHWTQQNMEWIAKQCAIYTQTKATTVTTKAKKQYHQYKEQARKRVNQKITYWNQYYNFSINRISIRNQRTRWGSCSSRMNININYKIIFLPDRLQDYLIVHELCHLAELNHSPRFWKRVSETIPDYKKRHYELRTHTFLNVTA